MLVFLNIGLKRVKRDKQEIWESIYVFSIVCLLNPLEMCSRELQLTMVLGRQVHFTLITRSLKVDGNWHWLVAQWY